MGLAMASIRSIRRRGQERIADVLLDRVVVDIVRRAALRIADDAWSRAIAKAGGVDIFGSLRPAAIDVASGPDVSVVSALTPEGWIVIGCTRDVSLQIEPTQPA